MKTILRAIFLMITSLLLATCSKIDNDRLAVLSQMNLLSYFHDDTNMYQWSVTTIDSAYNFDDVKFIIQPQFVTAQNSFSLIPTTYAKDHIEDPTYTLVEQIKSIQLYTSIDYNNNYPAGSELTELIVFEDNQTIEQFIKSINSSNINYFKIKGFSFTFAQQPDANIKEIKFFTIVNMSGGAQITSPSNIINLK